MSVKLRDAEGATLLQKACSSAVPLSCLRCAMLCHAGAIRMESPVSWSPVECCGVLWHSAELEILGAEATHSGRIPILKLITEKGGNLNAKAR